MGNLHGADDRCNPGYQTGSHYGHSHGGCTGTFDIPVQLYDQLRFRSHVYTAHRTREQVAFLRKLRRASPAWWGQGGRANIHWRGSFRQAMLGQMAGLCTNRNTEVCADKKFSLPRETKHDRTDK